MMKMPKPRMIQRSHQRSGRCFRAGTGAGGGGGLPAPGKLRS
ncbi:hypothetical protein [Sphingomonas hankookensis]